MMNYKITVVYMTYRPGGMDLLSHALANQDYKNYELIVIDDYPGRNLRGYLEEKGIPVTYYGPMKEKVLKDTTYSQANVLNTALLYATGDILVVYNDYSWIPPESLESILQ
jgi:glycosyltransferase involved in cell wall biosynthesis